MCLKMDILPSWIVNLLFRFFFTSSMHAAGALRWKQLGALSVTPKPPKLAHVL